MAEASTSNGNSNTAPIILDDDSDLSDAPQPKRSVSSGLSPPPPKKIKSSAPTTTTGADSKPKPKKKMISLSDTTPTTQPKKSATVKQKPKAQASTSAKAKGSGGKQTTLDGQVIKSKGKPKIIDDTGGRGDDGDKPEVLNIEKLERLVPETIKDDYQIAYVWAFLQKFDIKVKGLFAIEELEQALGENIPSDIITELVVTFLYNLNTDRKTKRVEKDALPSYLKSYIHSRLQPKQPLTVWDPYFFRPYIHGGVKPDGGDGEDEDPALKAEDANVAGPSEIKDKGKGKEVQIGDQVGDATDDSKMELDSVDSPLSDPSEEQERQREAEAEEAERRKKAEKEQRQRQANAARLKRNPLSENGLWELGWHDKATILRQLVDWQLCESHIVRDVIDGLYERNKPQPPETRISIKFLEKDSQGRRIWSLDTSYRLYAQTLPMHFRSPWTILTTTEEQYHQLVQEYKDSAATIMERTRAINRRKKEENTVSKMDFLALQGCKRDKILVEMLEKVLPVIEEHQEAIDSRRSKFLEGQARAKRKEEAAINQAKMQEFYLSEGKTRRATASRTINYNENAGNDVDDEEEDDMVTYYPPVRGRNTRSSTSASINGGAAANGRRSARQQKGSASDSYNSPTPSPAPEAEASEDDYIEEKNGGGQSEESDGEASSIARKINGKSSAPSHKRKRVAASSDEEDDGDQYDSNEESGQDDDGADDEEDEGSENDDADDMDVDED